MNINFIMKTRIISGNNCIYENKKLIAQYGRRTLIVTGAHGAAVSGALGDIKEALESQGIEYQVFSEAEPNPKLATCYRGGAIARSFYAQFIIGIGGGSALDAAKAVAVFAANDIQPKDLFLNKWPKAPLPVLAIGTTSGTGSEVNQYGVITVPDLENKKSFASYQCFPEIAFVDPKYTYSLNRDATISTALDAFCHATESYFSKFATAFSRDIAISAIKLLWPPLKKLSSEKEIDYEDRRCLCYGSVYGGIAIAQTGTCFPHTMGYMPTYWHNVPHGRATAFFTGDFLRFCQSFDREGISYITALCGEKTLEDLLAVFCRLNPVPKIMTKEQAEKYAQVSSIAPSFQKSGQPYPTENLIKLYSRFIKDETESDTDWRTK